VRYHVKAVIIFHGRTSEKLKKNLARSTELIGIFQHYIY